MPAAVVLPPPEGDIFAQRRKRWTRDECYDLIRIGKLAEGKFELIQGEIVNKMPQEPEHSQALGILLDWLAAIFGIARIRPQLPLPLSRIDEPEPDLAVTRKPRRAYGRAHPGAEDIALLVEVGHSSIREDTTIKAALYARADIGEYWVIDTGRRRLVVFREPREGIYQSVVSYGEDETIAPLAAPEAPIRVGDLLP